jgi:hypothetical protein
MIPLLTSLKKSPFQPVLHPKYSALMDELVQMQESSEGALRNNLQSLINLRKLLNIPNRNIQNQNNQEAEEAAMGNGLGALGPRPGNNANIFERGGFLVFKILQIFLLWQLISLVITNISAGHIFILLVIVVAYLCIDHFQKNKNNQNNQNNQNAQP